MLNLKLLAGRDFSRAYPTDTAAYIINETALKPIGYKNPIGRSLSIFGGPGHIILLIALLTVSYQSIKSAFANPIQSLRPE